MKVALVVDCEHIEAVIDVEDCELEGFETGVAHTQQPCSVPTLNLGHWKS